MSGISDTSVIFFSQCDQWINYSKLSAASADKAVSGEYLVELNVWEFMWACIYIHT